MFSILLSALVNTMLIILEDVVIVIKFTTNKDYLHEFYSLSLLYIQCINNTLKHSIVM